jgi:hypothetical protein
VTRQLALVKKLSGKKYYAVMDLTSGYHQCLLTEEASLLTSFVTSRGIYRWIRVPFGLQGAPSYFQKAMADEVLHDLIGKACEIYIDDVIVYGDMQINTSTNINTVENLLNNTLCGQETPIQPTSGSKYLRCNVQQDPDIYLMTSNNIGESSPIRVSVNSDKTISLNLLTFNSYGYPTKNYALTFCNFNVITFSYIEKITNTLGTFLVNMVCFTNVQDNSSTKNQLKFTVELINFPTNFIKENSVFTIN